MEIRLNYIGEAKTKLYHAVEGLKVKALRDSETIASDPHVASSRAANAGEDGSYVGRTGPDIDSAVEQSGAEARSEENRLSP
jgi:hypothetical protein